MPDWYVDAPKIASVEVSTRNTSSMPFQCGPTLLITFRDIVSPSWAAETGGVNEA